MSRVRQPSRGGRYRNTTTKNPSQKRGPRRKNVCHSCKSNHLRCEPVPLNDVHSQLCRRCMNEARRMQIHISACEELAPFLGKSSHSTQTPVSPQDSTFHSFLSGEGAQQHTVTRPHPPPDGDAVPFTLSQASIPSFPVDSTYSLQAHVSQATQVVNSFPGSTAQMGISYNTPTAPNHIASPDRAIQLSPSTQWSGHNTHTTPYLIPHPAWAHNGYNPPTPTDYHSASFAEERVTNINSSHATHDPYGRSSAQIPDGPNFHQNFGVEHGRQNPLPRQEFQPNADQSHGSLIVSIPLVSKSDIYNRNPPSSATSMGSFPFTPSSRTSNSHIEQQGILYADKSPNDNTLVTAAGVHGSYYSNMDNKQEFYQ